MRGVIAFLIFLVPVFLSAQNNRPIPGYLDGLVIKNMVNDTELKKRMALVMEHKLSPFDAFPVSSIIKWTIGAALRGNLHVIPEFFAKGKRASFVNRELKSRRKLLAEVESTT